MTTLIGCAVCELNGRIARAYDFANSQPNSEYTGTITWEWFDQNDRQAAQMMFAMAAIGKEMLPATLDMDLAKVGTPLCVVAQYLSTGNAALPVLGVFVAYPAVVKNLTPRERDVARLLPAYNVKQIAAKLDISPSTVETLKGRLAIKLGANGPRLHSMLAKLQDVI